MKRPFDDEARLYARQRGTSGLALFDAQREASPEVARAEMPGAGQLARRIARERQTGKLEATYALIARVLEAYPDGLTRKEVAERAGLNVNTVNGRCAEMRAFLVLGEDPATWPWALYTEGRRNGESILHLARLKP